MAGAALDVRESEPLTRRQPSPGTGRLTHHFAPHRTDS
ncbi:hypothetical protein [Arthrobacter sp. PL16]